MERQEKAGAFAVSIAAMAANNAVIRLCAVLAAKGVISGAEVESLRHLHLHDFDGIADSPETPAPERAALEEIRAALDNKWDLAKQVPLSGVLHNPPKPSASQAD